MHKHYFNRWLLLLLPLALFSACKDYDGSPYDEEGYYSVFDDDRVFLGFALENPTSSTRMSNAVTQAIENANGSHFRGMTDMVLLPFSVQGSGVVSSTSTAITTKLAEINSIPKETTTTNTPTQLYNNGSGGANSKYYLQQPMPIGTNAVLAYGRAPGDNSALSGKQTYGILNNTGLDGKAPSAISFSPVPIVSSIPENPIIAYLNTIFDATWNTDAKPVLKGIYPMVKDMQSGSSASVLAFLQKVYDMLSSTPTAAGVNAALTAIDNSTYVTITDGKIAFKDAYKNYPGSFGLPDGAAVITWKVTETSAAFEAVTSKTNFNGLNVDVAKFCFPAELWYRANSRIHTSTMPITSAVDTHAKSVFNKGAWAGNDNTSVLGQFASGTEGAKLFTANGIVQSNTTIVAVTNPLQYAVGRVDFKLVTPSAGVLKDAEQKEFNPNSFKITGVLIGEQSPVDFEFKSKWATETDPLYTIYDNQIETDPDASLINGVPFTHTLALETKAGQKVNVAIELINNDTEKRSIMTVSGNVSQIIPYGCKFYVVGQIDPANPTVGSETAGNKAIAQDHITAITFTLKDLTKAYYWIPDLNTSDLEFSLGVIDWKLSTPVGLSLE